MHIKVYFHDKPLFLTDQIDPEIEPFRHHDDAIFIDEFSPPAINSMIHEMKQQRVHAGILFHEDLDKLKKAFFKKFTLTRAAGGLVVNQRGEILLIHRRAKWDLPKGKIDPGESPEVCAVREVQEETGLLKASIEKHLLTTYHTYDESGKHILKPTEWYLMRSPNQDQLQPQTGEQITEVVWASPKSIHEYSRNTFALIKDVFARAELL